MFVMSADGKHYPIASVDHLSTAEDGSDHAKLKDGGTVELAKGEIDRLMLHSGQPFPAAPDTFVLEEIDERCRSSSYARVPVLDWVLCHGRGVLPITTEGLNHGLGRAAPVLMPTGEVVLAGECTYADEDCFLNELRSSRAS